LDTYYDLPASSSASRARRAVGLMALSMVTIMIAAIGYVKPNAGSTLVPAIAGKAPLSAQLAAVDYVTPDNGWVVVEPLPQRFAVLRTTNAGATWIRQLAGAAGSLGEYLRFFDSNHGVLVLLGPHGSLYQTNDGGGSWSLNPTTVGSNLWSADFVDADHGWLLVKSSGDGPSARQALLRTRDGGTTWAGLGSPVLPRDWAYRVEFANLTDGWMYSKSAGPYAYKSEDGGTSWHRILLPPPPGGWPAAPAPPIRTETFFVAAHPTAGSGVMTTVIGIAPLNWPSPDAGVALNYPPLKVGTFDGRQSITYVYADVSPYRYSSIEYVNPGEFVSTEPEDQYQLSSIDGGRSWHAMLAPSTYGAVGYVDAQTWWWIGSGAGSTSMDAGRTWSQASGLGLPEPLPGSLGFMDATHAWFGAMVGQQPVVEVTQDGGVHWKKIGLPELS
jgi:photosystem II stability/assembly factor-like uncharacterized protein